MGIHETCPESGGRTHQAVGRRGEVKDGGRRSIWSASLGFRKLFNLPLSFSSEGHPSRFGIRIIAVKEGGGTRKEGGRDGLE